MPGSYFTFSLAVKKDEVIIVLEWQLKLRGRVRVPCAVADAKTPTWGTSRQDVKCMQAHVIYPQIINNTTALLCKHA